MDGDGLVCRNCGYVGTDEWMYEVKVATKPPKTPHRWKKLGYCCEWCKDRGCVVTFEYKGCGFPPRELT